ncbi:hypothetical protein ZWY2020_059432 [Hordeum vulgare]|nr:hypothetical protein ZWY2020_059432 [Hordeum vulgare]
MQPHCEEPPRRFFAAPSGLDPARSGRICRPHAHRLPRRLSGPLLHIPQTYDLGLAAMAMAMDKPKLGRPLPATHVAPASVAPPQHAHAASFTWRQPEAGRHGEPARPLGLALRLKGLSYEFVEMEGEEGFKNNQNEQLLLNSKLQVLIHGGKPIGGTSLSMIQDIDEAFGAALLLPDPPSAYGSSIGLTL